MKYILALILSLTFVAPIFAESQTTITTAGKLSEEQQATLAAQAAKMVADNATNASGVVSPSTAQNVKQWVDVGTAIGAGLASTARELGIAANDFVKTPVGKLTAGIIIWHFMGSSLVHIVFGLLWLIALIPVWIVLYRRISATVSVTTYDDGKGPCGIKRQVIREPHKLTEGQSFGFVIFGIAILVIGVSTLLTF